MRDQVYIHCVLATRSTKMCSKFVTEPADRECDDLWAGQYVINLSNASDIHYSLTVSSACNTSLQCAAPSMNSDIKLAVLEYRELPLYLFSNVTGKL